MREFATQLETTVIEKLTNIKFCKRREEDQLDATECFITLIICSTYFGHLYAHHQEFENIRVLLPHMVCNAFVVGGRLLGAGHYTPYAVIS